MVSLHSTFCRLCSNRPPASLNSAHESMKCIILMSGELWLEKMFGHKPPELQTADVFASWQWCVKLKRKEGDQIWIPQAVR